MKFTAKPVTVDAWTIIQSSAADGVGQNIAVTLENGVIKQITPAMYARYIPQAGDYLVVQEDGYEYVNPKAVFERKYAADQGARQMQFSPGQTVNSVLLPDGSRLIVPCETGQVSDGYHSFDELYRHRVALFIAFCRARYSSRSLGRWSLNDSGLVWRSKVQSDGTMYDGWFIAGIGVDAGAQITYHLPVSEWDRCWFMAELGQAPQFDGHTSDDVVDRLNALSG